MNDSRVAVRAIVSVCMPMVRVRVEGRQQQQDWQEHGQHAST